MDRFQAIRAFREVARQGGFAAAARALHCSTPTVSRLISELEADLGVRLLMRSTRSVRLTEEGERFLRRGAALVDELEAVTEEIRERKTMPRGHLRISSVVALGQEMVAPALTCLSSVIRGSRSSSISRTARLIWCRSTSMSRFASVERTGWRHRRCA